MYHVSHQGQQFGPYTVEQINQYLAQGAFDAGSHVWDANANGWIEIGQLPGVVLSTVPANATVAENKPFVISEVQKGDPRTRLLWGRIFTGTCWIPVTLSLALFADWGAKIGDFELNWLLFGLGAVLSAVLWFVGDEWRLRVFRVYGRDGIHGTQRYENAPELIMFTRARSENEALENIDFLVSMISMGFKPKRAEVYFPAEGEEVIFGEPVPLAGSDKGL